MKIRYIGIVLMFFMITGVIAQDQQSIQQRKTDERNAIEKPAPPNPAKMDQTIRLDPKIDPNQTPASPTNWKPGAMPTDNRPAVEAPREVHPVISIQQPDAKQPSQPEGIQPPVKSVKQPAKSLTQPEGEKPPAAVKKSTSAPSLTQPEGVKPH